MKDRYGVDELTTTVGLFGMVLTLIGALAQWRPLYWIAIVIMVLAILRAFSKNTAVRRRENDAFKSFAAKVPGLKTLVARMGTGYAAPSAANQAARKAEAERAKRTAKKMWKERKTSRFIKCPTCGQMLSVPKGKGKIRVTCPKCKTKMETKS